MSSGFDTPGEVDPESLQASREWKRLMHAYGQRTPQRMARVRALGRSIRSIRKLKPKK